MNILTQPTIKYPNPVIPRMAEYQYTLVINYDSYPENPREWAENLGTLFSFDRNSCGADETHNDPEQYLIEMVDQYDYGFEQRMLEKDESPSLASLVEIAEKYYIILPVFKYEHSGVIYNTTGFSCRWDSGQIGYIYVAKDKVREVYDWNRITSKRRKQVEAMLSAEIKMFSQWASGSVYSFQLYYHDVEKPYASVEPQDSCWGFYHDWPPTTLEELQECGIADNLPSECLNDDLVIVFE